MDEMMYVSANAFLFHCVECKGNLLEFCAVMLVNITCES